MKLVIFAGGAGTRLWPLSRISSPKQFGRMFNGQSTLELCLERIASFGVDSVYISTNQAYQEIVQEQAKAIAADHIFTEPTKRDLAAAIGLTLIRLKRRGVNGPIALLWADHLMDAPERFVAALQKAETLVAENPERIVFFGERPRFANHTLGWIEVGEKNEHGLHAFRSWKYCPEPVECAEMFASGKWLWNPGYFVFDLDWMLAQYARHQPEMYAALVAMGDDPKQIEEKYNTLPALHFDRAIIEKLAPEEAVVLPVELGWSDPGTLYALKEALAKEEKDNVIKGTVAAHESEDCLVFNEEPEKLVAVVGLTGMVVVNTKDALLVCQKDAVPEIKALLKKMEEEGKRAYL